MRSSAICCCVFVVVVLVLGPAIVAQTRLESAEPLPIELNTTAVGLVTSLAAPSVSEIPAHRVQQARRPRIEIIPTTLASPDHPYRQTIQNLSKHKYQFIHCKLTNGKILTGLIEADAKETFTISTNVLGAWHEIQYSELSEAPRAVPAVGTKFKYGLEWTGTIAFFLLILPLAVLGALPDC